MNQNCCVQIAVAVIILISGAVTGLCQNTDADLNAFFKDYLDKTFQLRPASATQLGDHRFDDRLDDLSQPARDSWVALTRSTLAVLPRKVDLTRLSPAGRMDAEILRLDLERSLWNAENFHPFVEDPRTYGEYISDSVFLLLAQSTQPKETNIANALARMHQIPRIVATARQTLSHPPRVFVETAIRQNKGAISFYESDIFELAGKTPQIEALRTSAAQVASCLKEYQSFLENELLPHADGDWRIGSERFARKLELEMDAGVTAAQVLSDAQTEFDRVQRDMYVIARQLWSSYFKNQPLPPDDAPGRAAVVRQVLEQIGKKHSKPENLVRDIRKDVKSIKQFIRTSGFLRLPDPDRCQIIEMPEFERGNSTAYMNSSPPLDPQAAAFYAVSPPPRDWDSKRVASYLEEYNDCMLQILTIHEAYPGHFVQFDYANQNPTIIRRVVQSGAYVEGWAVYTEQSMLDHGYGKGNLELRLTQLKFYLRAVANTILDHRMHCDNMTDDEAMKLLVEGAYQSEGEARLKVIRAKQSSVQLSTYFVGRMAHYRLRQAVERELGDQFDLARYHAAVLAPGPVPLKFLPDVVREQLRPPAPK